MDKQKKQRTKNLLLQKLKNLKIKSEQAPSIQASNNQPISISIDKPMMLKQKQQNKIYEWQSKQDQQEKQDKQRSILNQEKNTERLQQEKEQIMKQQQFKKSTRIKKPFYQHYGKEGIYTSILEYVRNHPNPSGRPKDIPPQMYNGIEVIPKRPWVFFGPENIPPSDCQQINEKTFSLLFQQAKKAKGTGIFKKSKKKGMKKNEDQFSQITEELTSNFTFSDSVDLSRESDLISEFRTQTKTQKVYDSSSVKDDQSQYDDDFSSVSGSVTQRHRYNLFDSSESEDNSQQSSSMEASKRRKKFKRLLESSDQQQVKSSTNRLSSHQGSSVVIPGSSGQGGSGGVQSKDGSSGKVQVDKAQSSVSESKSRSRQRPVKRAPRLRKPVKKEQESDS